MELKETQIQQAIVKWARFKNLPLVAIPNGAHVSLKNRKRLVSEGLSKGMVDLFLFKPNSKYHGLAIEVKSPRGHLRPEQKEWIVELERQGYACLVTNNAYECIESIEEYLSS